MFTVPDEHVEHALNVLKLDDHARKRAAAEYAEKQLKVTLARLARESNGKTQAEREQHALTSPDYAEALNAYRTVAEAYYAAKDRRDAAGAVIEAWRTANANARTMERVR